MCIRDRCSSLGWTWYDHEPASSIDELSRNKDYRIKEPILALFIVKIYESIYHITWNMADIELEDPAMFFYLRWIYSA